MIGPAPATITPDPALPLPLAVNQALRPITGPFDVSTAQVVDNAGNVTAAYSSVVRPSGSDTEAIPVDAVAAVILCDEELTIESLRVAYERIRQTKALPKTKGMKAEHEMSG